MFKLTTFADRLAGFLEVESGRRDEDANIFDDWALDSLQTFQLIVVVESMADVAVPPPTIPAMYTIGDVYAYYCSLVTDSEA